VSCIAVSFTELWSVLSPSLTARKILGLAFEIENGGACWACLIDYLFIYFLYKDSITRIYLKATNQDGAHAVLLKLISHFAVAVELWRVKMKAKNVSA
jgi:hypothetical protein